MRIGVVLVGIGSFLVSMYAVIFLVNNNGLATKAIEIANSAAATSSDGASESESPGHKAENADRPKVNKDKSAPQPKAVIEETEFKFDCMEVGEERSHAFVIRNEGQAPLEVVAGPTTCQCTV